MRNAEDVRQKITKDCSKNKQKRLTLPDKLYRKVCSDPDLIGRRTKEGMAEILGELSFGTFQ